MYLPIKAAYLFKAYIFHGYKIHVTLERLSTNTNVSVWEKKKKNQPKTIFMYFAAVESGSRSSQHYHFDLNDLQRGAPAPATRPPTHQRNLPKGACSNTWLTIVLLCIAFGWVQGWRQNDRLAALQEFRLFGGCDVCCCVLLLFWPCWAPMPTSYFSVSVMIKLAEAHSGDPRVLEKARGREWWQNEKVRQQDTEGWGKN